MSVIEGSATVRTDSPGCELCVRTRLQEHDTRESPRSCGKAAFRSHWSNAALIRDVLARPAEGRLAVEAAWAAVVAWFNNWPETVSIGVGADQGVSRRTLPVNPELPVARWLDEVRAHDKPNVREDVQHQGVAGAGRDLFANAVVLLGGPHDDEMGNVQSTSTIRLTPEALECAGRCDALDRVFVDRLRAKLERVIAAVWRKEQTRLLDVAVLDPEEVDEVVSAGASRPVTTDGGLTFAQLLRKRAADRPDATALVERSTQLSYAQLMKRVDTISMGLIAAGIDRGDRVGIMLPRSSNLILCMIACQMIGASFLVMDAGAPADRTRQIMLTAAPKLVIAAEVDDAGRLGAQTRLETVASLMSSGAQLPSTLQARPQDANLEAYVIFTSGTSGRPKAVSIGNEAFWSFCSAARDYLRLKPDDKIVQFALPSFDAIIEEVFPTLIEGACLVIRDDIVVGSVTGFFDWVADTGVTVLNLPTGYWREMISAAASLGRKLPARVRLAVIGGEALQDEDIRRWARVAETGAALLNTYGPTEASVVSTVWPVPSGTRNRETVNAVIGKPIRGRHVFIVDRFGRAAPNGAIGEIYIGGPGLATSYLGDPVATSHRFVTWNELPIAESRFYKTGDLGRMNRSWDCEFLGRTDSQVKWRGFRIELGEIAEALRRLPDVLDAAVLPVYEGTELKQLIGFYVAGKGSALAPGSARERLQDALPRYMLPSRLYRLDAIPLTAAGKTDLRALQAYAASQTGAAGEPRGDRRLLLSEIWKKSLKIDGVDDVTDFFACGGDSLASVEMLAEVAAGFGVDLPANQLYLTPAFGSFTRVVLAGQQSAAGLEADPHPARHSLAFASWREEEARLRADYARARSRPQALLTGASGFLGAMMLEDLLATDDDLSVVCLVRQNSMPEFERRVAGLKARIPDLHDRLTLVTGDMGAAELGLDRAEWWRLASSVDQIYNCAANTNMLLPYESLRATNVEGVRELLRLVNTGRTKRLNHISTLAVLGDAKPSAGEAESIGIQQIGNLASGYAQSKWVAEKLVMDAREQGVDCKIFRCGRIWGEGGVTSPNPNDFILSVLAACALIGIYPDIEFELDVAPVGYVSRAIRRLATLEDRSYVYHINSPEPISFRAICESLRPNGRALRPASYADWRRQVLEGVKAAIERPQSTPLRHLASIVPALASGDHLEWADHYVASARTNELLDRLKVRCPAPDALGVQASIDRLISRSSSRNL